MSEDKLEINTSDRSVKEWKNIENVEQKIGRILENCF